MLIALIPALAGLPQQAWYFFAIFIGVIVGLTFEPLPGGADGLIGVTLAAVLCEYVLYSPEQLAKPDFNPARAALVWALSGFSNTTVWRIFGAFMFALGMLGVLMVIALPLWIFGGNIMDATRKLYAAWRHDGYIAAEVLESLEQAADGLCPAQRV